MFEEYDVVILKSTLTGSPSIPVGTRGTVLAVYHQPRLAYEVEFMSDSGASLGVFTVEPMQVEEVRSLVAHSEPRR